MYVHVFRSYETVRLSLYLCVCFYMCECCSTQYKLKFTYNMASRNWKRIGKCGLAATGALAGGLAVFANMPPGVSCFFCFSVCFAQSDMFFLFDQVCKNFLIVFKLVIIISVTVRSNLKTFVYPKHLEVFVHIQHPLLQ